MALFIQLAQLDDSFLIWVRQWPQQHRIKHAENRSRSADAERQRQDRDQCKAGTLS